MNYYLKNAFLVNENRCRKGSLFIKDGFIEEICWELPVEENLTLEASSGNGAGTRDIPAEEKPGRQGGYQEIDLHGAYVIPGVIDDQVHFRQPGLTHKGDIRSESAAALLGGVTSFMDMPNTKPQTLTQALLAEKYAMGADDSLVNYSFYMGCSEDNLDEVLRTDPETVCGIKLFLGSSTGNMLVQDPVYLENLFKNAPTLIAAHCEEEGIIRENTSLFKARYGENIPFEAHPEIRSRQACYRSSSKAAALARRHGARLHILHLSTAEELSLLDPVNGTSSEPYADVLVSGEVCVHYLWFCDQDYPRLGARLKCNPAIKSASDRQALRQAVANGQAVVATDHAPHTWQEKQKTYLECPSGAPWVEHSLSMMLELAHQGVFSLEEVVQALCHRPAQLFGIEKRGFLRKGYHADLAVIDPGKAWKVEKGNLACKCQWSALEGETLHGRVLSVFVNGNLVCQDGKILLPGHRGRRLRFER